jgi:AmmeMemoRadiSam system radical SAM enzyme/AmmeMemoRadiSam system protein B/AmmeMemoRadiSam system protein A
MSRQVDLPPPHDTATDGNRAGGWWHERESGDKLVCDLCPRGCVLGPGDRGFCFVRQNVDDQIVSTTYGRSTGFCIDPIEKKPLFHFYPGSPVLSFGTAGCNLGCKFCQNWTSSKSREVDAYCDVADPQAIADAAHANDCRSVAFTYNDPIIWAEYAIDTARACRRAGVKTVAVTSGYITPAARGPFFAEIDAANVDLKGFTEDFYRKYSGAHLEPVLDTLCWLVRETDVWLELTTLIVPEANDSPEELRAMCDWVVSELGPDIPMHFSAFHPAFRLQDRPATPPSTLRAAYDIAREAGVNHVYLGNVHEPVRQSTYCPSCGEMVIHRDGYILSDYRMRGDRCEACGKQIAGRFADQPGRWGSRRQPVRIARFTRPQPKTHGEGSQPSDNPTSGGAASKPAVPSDPESTQPNMNEPEERPDGLDPATAPGAPELNETQQRQLLELAARRVAAAATGSNPPDLHAALGDLAGQSLLGIFVSLKREGTLRSCCGSMGEPITLVNALDGASVRAAREDPRFPPISPSELPHLDIEVWVLWDLRPIEGPPGQRPQAIEIGRHGLQVARGGARGLLLPGVAVEHNLDAEGFLRQVCRKARLPDEAWAEEGTAVWTFEGHPIKGRLGELIELPRVAAPAGPTTAQLQALADFARQNVAALIRGATPNYYLAGGYDRGVHGVALALRPAGWRETVIVDQLSLQPEIPLQSTLGQLSQAAATALRNRGVDPRAVYNGDVGLSVLWDPAMHGQLPDPKLEGFDPSTRALMVAEGPRRAWAFDPELSPEHLLAEVCRRAQLPEDTRSHVISYAVASTSPKAGGTRLPQETPVRPPVVAGQFYPGTAEEVNQEVDNLLPADRQPEPWAGAMVPHAGWIFSGRLAAETLSRVAIPETVIVLCPKHRRPGADWAVAPYQGWSIPGGEVPGDPDLAARLAESVRGLRLDATSHQNEHAIEVQLPLLARLAPGARVVGIAMHGGEWTDLERFAGQLAEVLGSLPQRPLLLVSTDMNHYADEAETQRLDRLALEAVEGLDPHGLLETVQSQRISMCGAVPASVAMEALRRLDALNRCELVGHATSAEASGDTRRVVGYAGALFA